MSLITIRCPSAGQTASPGTRNAVRIVVVDDDDLFRETIGLNLADAGYAVTSFSRGTAALAHIASGGRADVILLDWRMPEMNGLEVLRSLRRTGNKTPVIFLTMLSEDIYEEAALESGAVDFVDKSRSLSILMRRLRLIGGGARPAPESDGGEPGDVLQLGRLEVRFDINQASWAGASIDLTPTEFKIIALLALRNGEDVPYREIYDLVHGKGFTAGYGGEGYRTNVRGIVKRMRKKFRGADPEFDHIVNYAGFGYRYREMGWAAASKAEIEGDRDAQTRAPVGTHLMAQPGREDEQEAGAGSDRR